MPSAIFVVAVENTNPVAPPQEDQGDGSIYLNHGEGHGYSCVGEVPQTGTALVRIYSDQATIEAMATDAAERYLFIEQL